MTEEGWVEVTCAVADALLEAGLNVSAGMTDMSLMGEYHSYREWSTKAGNLVLREYIDATRDGTHCTHLVPRRSHQ